VARWLRAPARVTACRAAASPGAHIAALRRVGAPDHGAHVPVAQLGLADRPDPARPARRPSRRAPGLGQVLDGLGNREALAGCFEIVLDRTAAAGSGEVES